MSTQILHIFTCSMDTLFFFLYINTEKEWLKVVPPMGSDDEFEEDIKGHVVRQYTRRQAEKDEKYLNNMKKK